MPADDALSIHACLFIEVRDRVYRYRFHQAVTSVGSAEDNNVRIKEPSVAAHHMLLTWVDGHFFVRRIEDAAVRLNGERIEGWSEELRCGDVLAMGDVRLRLSDASSTADTAILIQATPDGTGPDRPWLLYLVRRTEFTFGADPSDFVLPGMPEGVRATIENFGGNAFYVVPAEGEGAIPRLNEEPIRRRTRMKNGDVVRLKGWTLRMRMLRGEVLDDAESLLWPESLRRFCLPPGD